MKMSSKENIKQINKLTSLQEGILFHCLLNPDSNTYFDQVTYRIKGKLNVSIVKQTIEELIDRHDALRTAIVHKETETPLQITLHKRATEFYYEDLSDIHDHEIRIERIRQYEAEDRRRSFDLVHDTLMRVSIFQEGPEEFSLIWSHHHIIMDGWCMGILITEFNEIYQSKLEERSPTLPVIIPYSSYLQWLSGLDQHAAETYWKNYLKDYKEAAIPERTISSGIDSSSYKNEHAHITLTQFLSKKLVEYATGSQITLGTALQTAWGLLLAKRCGVRDAVFGTVVSGRPAAIKGVNTMVGLFINTIPVRVTWGSETIFKELLASVQRHIFESEPFHSTPLTDIQQASGARQQLFDSIFVFENYPYSSRNQSQLSPDSGSNPDLFEIVNVTTFEETNYPLNVVVVPGDVINVRIIYDASVFDRHFIEGLLKEYQDLLTAVIDNKDATVDVLEIIPFQERQRLLVDLNNTRSTYPRDLTILDLFEEQVAKTPFGIAVVMDRQQLTYKELSAKSDLLAQYLISQHEVQHEDRIAIMLERSPTLIIAILGIIKAGCTYVPIDPGYPAKRINYILQDTGAKLAFSEKDVTFPETGIPFTRIDWETVLLAPAVQPTKLSASRNACQLAYIMYTSGSTGQPKGVMVEDRAVIRLVRNTNYTDIRPQDKILQLSNYAFDGSTFDIFGALLNGASLYLVPASAFWDTEELVSYITDYQVNIMFITTALFNNLVSLRPEVISQFDKIYFGGEDASLHHVRQALNFRKNPDSIVHVYGPTENTTFSTYHVVDAVAQEDLHIPIGKPISNTEVYVLDEDMHLTPYGVKGQLYVGGDGLARGYWRAPELSESRFVDNPFKPGSRLYRTGDLVRWRSDESLEFLGRNDQQVKIRGYRIETGEIENALLRHTNIELAFVTVRIDNNGDNVLIGYYVSHDGLAVTSLRKYLSELLPAYMIPSHFVMMEAFPLNTSGKIDVNLLPQYEISDQHHTLPQNEVEAKMTEIWLQVLALEKIDRYDDFFESGGHSLKATRLIAKITREFGKKVSIRDIFYYPTIQKLSQFLLESEQTVSLTVTESDPKPFYNLSYPQKRVWLASQLRNGNLTYNIPVTLKVTGTLDIKILESALSVLLKRHEILRTVFVKVDGEPKQRVHAYSELIIPVGLVDLTGEMNQDTLVLEWAIKEQNVPFDLENGPLLKSKVLQLNTNSCVLLFTIHHIISDGWSTTILMNELLSLYQSLASGQADTLLAPSMQYKDYAEWQHTFLSSPEMVLQENYWMSIFKDKATPRLNIFKKTNMLTEKPLENKVGIQINDANEVQQFAQFHNTTVYNVLLAVFVIMISKISGEEDIVVGTSVAGRNNEHLDRLPGMFINTLALRNYAFHDIPFNEFLESVRENTILALENQDYPLEQLIRKVHTSNANKHIPLFEVFFEMLHDYARAVEYPEDLLIEDYPLEIPTMSKFGLILTARMSEERILLWLGGDNKLFSQQDVENMGYYIKNILEQVLSNPDQKIWEIEMTTIEEDLVLAKGIRDRYGLTPYNAQNSVPETSHSSQITFNFGNS